MSKGWNCPVDGCDFGAKDTEKRSRGSVISHINAKADDDHDRAARDAVKQTDDPPVATLDASDDPDQPSEGADSASEGASEQGDTGDDESDEPTDSEMANDTEYQDQYSDDTDDENRPAEQDTAGDEAGVDVALPSLSPSTLLLLVGAAVVLFLAYRHVTTDDVPNATDAVEDSESDDSELVDLDSGHGGVDV